MGRRLRGVTPLLVMVLAACASAAGCAPPVCEQVGPPYAFHVTLTNSAGPTSYLGITVEAASGRDHVGYFQIPYDGWLDVEWGGAEPEGSLGILSVRDERGDGGEVVLGAALDDEGCPVTQHSYAGTGWWW